MFGHTYAESERTLLRSLAAPCAILIIADGTDIHQVELTALQNHIAVLLGTGHLAMVGDLLRRLRLDLLNTVRLDSIFRNDYLKVVCIPAGRPGDIHLACTLIEHCDIRRDRTIRRRLQLDVVQHNTAA